MLRIASNIAAIAAERAMGVTQRNVERAMQQLASGSRFAAPGEDAAGHAIAENMRSQVRAYQSARMNAENATSFVQVAEGALNEQNNVLIRLRELAVQAASDTYSETERGFLNDEYQGLVSEFDRIAKSTRFGSQPLLDGTTKEYEFQVGVHKGADSIIQYTNDTNTTSSNLELDGSSISDKSEARDNLDTIDKALMTIGSARAKLGAIQSRMDTATQHIDSQIENLSEAHSKMNDTDIAEAISTVRKGQILQQYQASMLAAANEQSQYSLRLIA